MRIRGCSDHLPVKATAVGLRRPYWLLLDRILVPRAELITQCSCSPLTGRDQQDACGQQISPWHEHWALSHRQHANTFHPQTRSSHFLISLILFSRQFLFVPEIVLTVMKAASFRNSAFLKTTQNNFHTFTSFDLILKSNLSKDGFSFWLAIHFFFFSPLTTTLLNSSLIGWNELSQKSYFCHRERIGPCTLQCLCETCLIKGVC